MLSIAWLFIKSNWKVVAFGILAAVILGYIGILKYQISSRDKTINEQKVVILAEKALNASLNDSVLKQNEAIAYIKAVSASQKKVGATLLAQAKQRNGDLLAKAQWLESQLAKPDAKGRGCATAIREFKNAN